MSPETIMRDRDGMDTEIARPGHRHPRVTRPAVVIIGSGAGGGTVAYELTTARDPVRGAGGRPVPDGRRLRERRVGRVQPDGLAGHAHHQRVAGGWRRTSPTCRPGSSRRSAARPRTGPARRRGSWTHEFRIRDLLRRASTAPTCSTGRSPWTSWRPTTTRPRSRSARPTGTAARRCRRTTTTRCSPTAPSGSATSTTRPARTARTPNRTTAARPRSRTASTSRATRTAPSGRTAVREIPRALATGKLRPAARAARRCKITHDAQRQGRRRRVRRHGRQPAPAGRHRWSASPATRSSRRGCC